MSQFIHMLIVEDEPLMRHVLQIALKQLEDTQNLNIKTTIVGNYEDAKSALHNSKKQPIDILLLNIDVQSTTYQMPVLAEQLQNTLKTQYSKTKLMVFSAYCDNYKINHILNTINPEGFFIKSDINFKALAKAIKVVLLGELFYSKAIMQQAKKHSRNTVLLDPTDRQLLYFLSKGIKAKALKDYLFLPEPIITQRKSHIKQCFGIHNGNDAMLLTVARAKGFV